MPHFILTKFFEEAQKCLTELRLVICNRWGEKVYHTEDKTFEWDGTYNRAILNNHLAGTEVFVYRMIVTAYPGREIKKT